MTEPAPRTFASGDPGRADGSDDPGLDRLLECIDHPLLWPARYLEDTAALPALPLVFWLTEMLAPASVRTEGPGSEVAHLAFCQAAERLGLEMDVAHAGDMGAACAEARAEYGPMPDVARDTPVDILVAGLPETGTPSLKELAGRVSEDGALLLFGPGMTQAILADVPATDMQPLIFGAAKPQVGLLLGPGAPSPLSDLAALPPDSEERQAVSRFVTRMGEVHRLDLAAQGPGTRPDAALQDVAPPPSRHAEDVERLLAKMIEMEEDRLALRRNRPATPSAPAPGAPGAADATVALQDRMLELEAEHGVLRQRADEAERDLRAIRASTSWRITAPLRAVVRMLRGRTRG